MICYKHSFLINKAALLRRKELITGLLELVPGIRFISFILDDNLFIMQVEATKRVEDPILFLIGRKQLYIHFLDCIEHKLSKNKTVSSS